MVYQEKETRISGDLSEGRGGGEEWGAVAVGGKEKEVRRRAGSRPCHL
jgi:hypothetical protein